MRPNVEQPDFAYGDIMEASDRRVDEMAKALSALGYAEDAARETTELLLLLRQARVRAETIQARLCGVWNMLWKWSEYKVSEQSFKNMLEKYRLEAGRDHGVPPGS